ncbi:acyltransferase family protein [Conexibacter arvalis]|uniref:Acyltransferase 3 domain-containing protein n=1 Tax=Conexibacter arvalis TaxID=912552 RepID=A0A840IML5_9ACTN|nr:acyltransferase [Conexibacter arvalis]MBB4665100.1 hypothetical protein [Conexibacter arvalis]
MGERQAYLDNIKVLLVCGVIALHAAITYGFPGAWYLESHDELPEAVVAPLTVVLVIGSLFGLGLFFLIAGKLTGPSLDRRGPAGFARERLLRLGLPIVAYTLCVSPFMEYVDHLENEGGSGPLLPFLGEQVWKLAPGPTWFLEALLAFSLAYALLRWLRRDRGMPAPAPATAPAPSRLRGRTVIAVVVAISVCSFLVRLAFPLGTQQAYVQLAAFPQYVALFALGVAAGRRGWLETLAPSLVRRCAVAAAIAALAVPLALVAGGFFESDAAEDRFMGGWHWQAAAAALSEGVLSTCVSLLAVDQFRRRWNALTPLTRRMAPAAYGAFVVHPPVLVLLALAIAPLSPPVVVTFLVVLVGGVAGSFGLAALAARAAPIARVTGSGGRGSVAAAPR